MDETDISVAVIEQSDRTDNLIKPLQATEMDVSINPADPYGHDIIVCETPDRRLAKEVFKKPLHDAQLVFRMRGNPFYGIDEWIDSRIKTWLAKSVVMPSVDGCITITPSHAKLFEAETGVPTETAQLRINPENWPETTHTDRELRILSLTNCMYKPKIDPLVNAAPVVNQILDDVGGQWIIGGKGNYSDRLARGVAEFDNISFPGYVDAHDHFDRTNLLLHLSNLDGWPNVALEAMSSDLPVITNDHHAFIDHDRPNVVVHDEQELRTALQRFTDPDERQKVGQAGYEYVCDEHNDQTVGRSYVQYFKRVLSRESFERLHGVPHPEHMLDYDR
jgi:glycosyltransferase involved in cell wall biosynthesis